MPFRLVPEPPQIGDDDGFSKSDIFDARESGERLAGIVSDLEGYSVLVLDGRWGSGKSVFVKQWAGLLRKRGHPVVYFDAFEHDHLDDAFFPLFGHLLQASNGGDLVLSRFRDPLVEKATAIADAMPRILADAAVRITTGGLYTAKGVSELLEPTDAGITAVRESLNRSDRQMSAVNEFRVALQDAVSTIGATEEQQTPLVFVIDELDRCRPSYALNILERMKHVFAVDSICFVLVTHLRGLADMVTREYGLTDGAKYLEKFFHLRFDIDRLLYRRSEDLRHRYLEHLANNMNSKWNQDHFSLIIANNLIRRHAIPLRTQERIMLNIVLFDRAMESRDTTIARLVGERECIYSFAAALCVMREIAPRRYQDASMQRLEYSRANDFLMFREWSGVAQGAIVTITTCWAMATLGGKEHLPEGQTVDYDAFHMNYRRVLADVCNVVEQFSQ